MMRILMRIFQHLLECIQSRKMPATQLERLAAWLDTESDEPGREVGNKCFPGRLPQGGVDQDVSAARTSRERQAGSVRPLR